MWILIIILGFIADRITKIWATHTLLGGKDIEIISGFFTLSYLENEGAAFGIFEGNFILLYVIAGLFTIVMLAYLILKKQKSTLMQFSFGLVLAGAIGNMYDRIMQKYVVDFIQWHYLDKYYFPTFNIADTCVSIGTVFLVIYFLKEEKNEKNKISVQSR